ncbi:hypothetical protein Lepto7375DRAFT_0664 [Leptolyngbya sp. PCC 7375]|nr:hypothetical protein Lepto7375DRAFT_0664 [Leptolyngbya sp. PCC 7375]
MPTIAIKKLYPAGTTFFSESESFLGDLKDDALANVNGGFRSIDLTSSDSTIRCGTDAITNTITSFTSVIVHRRSEVG